MTINRQVKTGNDKQRSPLGNLEYGVEHGASSIKQPAAGSRQPTSGNRQTAAGARGFTLMEIMLAFLILGIVLTTILASFNAVFSSTENLNNSSRYYDMAKNCLNRMTLDLGGLYITQPPLYKPPDFDDPPDPYRIVSASTDVGGTSFASIRFASKAHIPFDKTSKGGVAEIVYYVQNDNAGQRVLRRADHLYPYPEFEGRSIDPVLITDVKSLAFKYYDSEGSEFEEWNSDSDENAFATPTAIGIELEIGNESLSYFFETTVRLTVHRKKIES